MKGQSRIVETEVNLLYWTLSNDKMKRKRIAIAPI